MLITDFFQLIRLLFCLESRISESLNYHPRAAVADCGLSVSPRIKRCTQVEFTSVSERSHLRTHSSFLSCLFAIKISYWYLKRFAFYHADKWRANKTKRQKYYRQIEEKFVLVISFETLMNQHPVYNISFLTQNPIRLPLYSHSYRTKRYHHLFIMLLINGGKIVNHF